MSELEQLGEDDLPEPLVSSLEELRPRVLAALEEAMKATVTRRVERKCSKCGHPNRFQVTLPNGKARLDAGRFVYEQLAGRATSRPAEKDDEDERIHFFRITIDGADLINRAVKLGLLRPEDVETIVSAERAAQEGNARRVY